MKELQTCKRTSNEENGPYCCSCPLEIISKSLQKGQVRIWSAQKKARLSAKHVACRIADKGRSAHGIFPLTKSSSSFSCIEMQGMTRGSTILHLFILRLHLHCQRAARHSVSMCAKSWTLHAGSLEIGLHHLGMIEEDKAQDSLMRVLLRLISETCFDDYFWSYPGNCQIQLYLRLRAWALGAKKKGQATPEAKRTRSLQWIYIW